MNRTSSNISTNENEGTSEGVEVNQYEGQRSFDDATDPTYDEESPTKIYDEEEYLAEVGEVNCYCVPSRVYGFKDFMFRTVAWTLLNKEQIIGGLIIAITQIPEAVSSALIAGISPTYALQATWLMNIITSLVGGRPGMISGSTTFVAVALMQLVDDLGYEYMFYAVLFAGFLQINFGLLGLGALTRYIPVPVIQGFSNAMALIIFGAQFRYGKVHIDESFRDQYVSRQLSPEIGHSWEHIIDKSGEWYGGFPLLILGCHAILALLLCTFLPRLTRVVPSAFVALMCCTFIEHVIIRLATGKESATIEDYVDAKITTLKPIWFDDSIDLPPFDFSTFRKIWLHGLGVFGAASVETFLTLHIVDELTEVKGIHNRVIFGQGACNVVSCILGGMGGSASIAQSVVANHSDGITNMSTFVAGAIMLLFLYVTPGFINLVPLGAVAGVMTWSSLKLLDLEALLQVFATILPLRVRDKINLDCKVPRADTFIMICVMVFTVCIDLAIGVSIGIFVAAFVYVWDSSTRVIVEREVSTEDSTNVTYNVTGPLFFATASGFSDIFPLEEIQFDPDEVIILLESAEIYDYSGMSALKKVYDRFADAGKVVALSSLTPSSRRLMEKSAYMWQGVNFLEVEEIDPVNVTVSKSVD